VNCLGSMRLNIQIKNIWASLKAHCNVVAAAHDRLQPGFNIWCPENQWFETARRRKCQEISNKKYDFGERGFEEVKAGVYRRVSTFEQDATIQQKICREYAERNKIEIYRVYMDTGISGMKDRHPAFNDLLIACTQNLDTSSAVGKLQLQIFGAFAEFERNIISERTREGLRFAKNVGKRGSDNRPRKKRGVLRQPLNMVEKGRR